jgi:hypothetical protein
MNLRQYFLSGEVCLNEPFILSYISPDNRVYLVSPNNSNPNISLIEVTSISDINPLLFTVDDNNVFRCQYGFLTHNEQYSFVGTGSEGIPTTIRALTPQNSGAVFADKDYILEQPLGSPPMLFLLPDNTAVDVVRFLPVKWIATSGSQGYIVNDGKASVCSSVCSTNPYNKVCVTDCNKSSMLGVTPCSYNPPKLASSVNSVIPAMMTAPQILGVNSNHLFNINAYSGYKLNDSGNTGTNDNSGGSRGDSGSSSSIPWWVILILVIVFILLIVAIIYAVYRYNSQGQKQYLKIE